MYGLNFWVRCASGNVYCHNHRDHQNHQNCQIMIIITIVNGKIIIIIILIYIDGQSLLLFQTDHLSHLHYDLDNHNYYHRYDLYNRHDHYRRYDLYNRHNHHNPDLF